MKGLASLLVGAVCVGSLLGCSTQKARTEAPPPPKSVSATHEGQGKLERHHLTTVTATVVAVDHEKRDLTLRGPKGNTVTVAVGDEVKNLDQVRKGDHVVARYYEAVAVQLKKPGEAAPGVSAAEGGTTAAKGQKPAGSGARVVTITATIVNVDRKHNTVTLKGPKGRSTVVDVEEPRYLTKVKKGDLVEITYTQALAISVEAAGKKKN